MDYYYDFGYGYGDWSMIEEIVTSVGFAILGVLAVFALVAAAIGIAMYVLESIGIYAIANRRGIRNAWLAWIPMANYWILGSISDQYQYVVKGKVTNRRKVLLILGICTVALSGALSGARAALVVTGAEEAAFLSGALGVISALVGSGLSIALLVFYYIAVYDLYSSVSPQNNVLFLVLSILFRVTEPFFVFCNRKKDDGMPPRREAPQTYIPEPVVESVPNPQFWENNAE